MAGGAPALHYPPPPGGGGGGGGGAGGAPVGAPVPVPVPVVVPVFLPPLSPCGPPVPTGPVPVGVPPGTGLPARWLTAWRTASSRLLSTWRRIIPRSEERRVGKECRSRWSPYH